MKKLLIVFLLVVCNLSGAYAAKSHVLKIEILDAESNEPVKDIRLTIYGLNEEDQILYSDSNGQVTIGWTGSRKYVRITAEDTSGFYRHNSMYLEKSDLKEELIVQTIRLLKAPDYDELFAEFRKLDAEIDEQNRINGVNTFVYEDAEEDCPDLIEAQFSGGAVEMQRYINKTINYPEESIEFGEQGRVYLKFIVETDGSISHVKIERGVSAALDYESARVVYGMPKWIPGTCEGKAVRTLARIPIIYQLE